jgi:hypothetical protein
MRTYTLISSTHSGNTSGAQQRKPRLSLDWQLLPDLDWPDLAFGSLHLDSLLREDFSARRRECSWPVTCRAMATHTRVRRVYYRNSPGPLRRLPTPPTGPGGFGPRPTPPTGPGGFGPRPTPPTRPGGFGPRPTPPTGPGGFGPLLLRNMNLPPLKR